MDWIAGKSYYIGYSSIDRFDSIIFFHNYFYSWSIGIICSLILPILYLFAPTSLQTNRTSYFLIICLVCLSNMWCICVQPYLLSGSGEPNLSIHTCRLIVYFSTFAKPMGLYLTLLFSIERICTKSLANLVFQSNKHRLLLKRCFLVSIFVIISCILSIRLFQVVKLIENNSTTSTSKILSRQNTINADYNSSDSILTFQYCYRSMNIGTYAKFLSFYIIQYWFEYVIFGIIILVFVWIVIYQYCLPRFQQRSLPNLSVNTKLYLSLGLSVILVESVLLLLHLIVDDVDYNNTDTQVTYLQTMLFVYNFRCILLPSMICLTMCHPLKQWFYELFYQQPYLDHVNETDHHHHLHTMIDRSEIFSSSQQTNSNEPFDL